MGAIVFGNDPKDNWVVAGWAFRQVLDDVSHRHPKDFEMVREFEEAKAISALIIYKIEPELAQRITNAIVSVAESILSGSTSSELVNQLYGNPETVAQYRTGLSDLLQKLRKAGGTGGEQER